MIAGDPIFSIIIPVYNTANYVEACIQSILDQRETNFEMIAIDDGSTDESRSILDAIAAREPRLHVFSKANGGQGSARNLGLTKARGRYVAFVDSDDTIDPEMLSIVIAEFSNTTLDIVSYGIEFRDQTGKAVATRGPASNFHSSGNSIFLDAMLDRNFLSSVCNKVYRRSLLQDNGIIFPELRAYEDSVFSRHVARHACHVSYLNNRLYYALTRSGSTSRHMTRHSFILAAEMLNLERRMFFSDASNPVPETVFRAHVAHFLAYLTVLAAFRIDAFCERAACRQIADDAGFRDCASDPHALALLSTKAKIQVFLARHPVLLRAGALMARRLGHMPY